MPSMSPVEFLLVKVLSSMVVPPGSNIILALLGLLLLPFARRVAAFVVLVAVTSLYAFSTALVAGALERSLYEHPALSPGTELSAVGTIVVLGAGSYPGRLDYDGRVTASGRTLERLRHAVSLHRRTGLPLLVAGGLGLSDGPTEAELMTRSLENDFGIAPVFVESRSRNTEENAAHSAALLAEAGITRIALVTHATHMSRAVDAFERQGLTVAPAPVVTGNFPSGVNAFRPGAGALAVSAYAIHEYVGRLWYPLRY